MPSALDAFVLNSRSLATQLTAVPRCICFVCVQGGAAPAGAAHRADEAAAALDRASLSLFTDSVQLFLCCAALVVGCTAQQRTAQQRTAQINALSLKRSLLTTHLTAVPHSAQAAECASVLKEQHPITAPLLLPLRPRLLLCVQGGAAPAGAAQRADEAAAALDNASLSRLQQRVYTWFCALLQTGHLVCVCRSRALQR
jgi:hypothetical protein